MIRLLATVTLIAFTTVAHTAPRGRGQTTQRATPPAQFRPAPSFQSNRTISTANFTPAKTTFSNTNTGFKTVSNTGKNFNTAKKTFNGKPFASKIQNASMVKGPGKNSKGFVSSKQYAGNYGVKFKRGVFYRGLNHRHWSARHFNPRWQTWCWYCPSTCGWYYYCGEKSCYLPVTVIADYPPADDESQESIPPDSEDLPEINGEEAPDSLNPEGIE